MPKSKHVPGETYGAGGHPETVRVPRHHLVALIERVVEVLTHYPYDPSLNGLREALDPIESATELRRSAPSS